MNRSEVRKNFDGKGGVTVVHVPTGVHITVNSSPSEQLNLDAAMRLLQSRLSYWDKFHTAGK